MSCRHAVSCLWQSIEARCLVENEDVVGAAPTGDAPTASEWSTMSLPTKVCLILETWRYMSSVSMIYKLENDRVIKRFYCISWKIDCVIMESHCILPRIESYSNHRSIGCPRTPRCRRSPRRSGRRNRSSRRILSHTISLVSSWVPSRSQSCPSRMQCQQSNLEDTAYTLKTRIRWTPQLTPFEQHFFKHFNTTEHILIRWIHHEGNANITICKNIVYALTQWAQHKMAPNLQTTFSNAFYCMKIVLL